MRGSRSRNMAAYACSRDRQLTSFLVVDDHHWRTFDFRPR